MNKVKLQKPQILELNKNKRQKTQILELSKNKRQKTQILELSKNYKKRIIDPLKYYASFFHGSMWFCDRTNTIDFDRASYCESILYFVF